MHLITSTSILLTLSTSVRAVPQFAPHIAPPVAPPIAPKVVTPISKAIVTPASRAIATPVNFASPIVQSAIKASPPSVPVPPKVDVAAGVNAAVSAQAAAAALIISAQLSAIAQLSIAPINIRPPPLPSVPSIRPAQPLPSSSLASRVACPCFTATVVQSNPACAAFTPPGGGHCVHPLCYELTTTTIPTSNSYCPVTPTYTSYLPCETSCERGCGKGTSTITAKETCLAQTVSFPSAPRPQTIDDPLTHPVSFSSEKIPTPTPKPISPSLPRFSSPASPSSQPPRPTSTPPRSSSPVPTPTPTPRPRPCYTSYVLSPSRCPSEATCPVPDCIQISTVSVPAGSVRGCPVTPTQTLTRSCRLACGACSTTYRTVTVSEWVEVKESAQASAGVREQGFRAQEWDGIKAGEKIGGSGSVGNEKDGIKAAEKLGGSGGVGGTNGNGKNAGWW